MNRVASPLLLTVQALLALFCAWTASRLLGLWTRLAVQHPGRIAHHVFVAERRWLFWAMVAAAAAVYALWLLGWWPGLMTRDSIDSWIETKRLDFHNWNPFVYPLYVLVLTQFYDSPAAVAIVQLLATAALGSTVFFLVHRAGLRFRWIAPFFLAFALSVPVAVYNLVVWKDVPFCLLTVFWACTLYYLAYRKRTGTPVVPDGTTLAALASSFVLLALIRHNGAAYLVVLPVILALGRLLPTQQLVRFLALSALLWIGVQFGVGTWIGAHANTNYRSSGSACR